MGERFPELLLRVEELPFQSESGDASNSYLEGPQPINKFLISCGVRRNIRRGFRPKGSEFCNPYCLVFSAVSSFDEAVGASQGMHYGAVGNTPFSNPIEPVIPKLGDESSVFRSLNADMHDGSHTDYYRYIWRNDNYVSLLDVMAISERITEADVRRLVDRMQAHYVR